MTIHEYTLLAPFCGLGAGALGFQRAMAKLMGQEAKFRVLGGIDVDPLACADFEYLTGAPALCTDIAKLTPAELRAFAGDVPPDVVFTSAPCKGSSGLLPQEKAKLPEYQALNRLALDWLELMVSTWDLPPKLLLFENVPRIQSRASDMLKEIRKILKRAGYLLHEGYHECGELGGLAQKRQRYLLVARQPKRCPPILFQPPKKRLRACGEVLGPLPMPNDPAGGPLHQLPGIGWLNWVRLGMIPAGGDHRDLPGVLAEGQERRALWKRNAVERWDAPTGTVTGPGASAVENVADPRAGDWYRNTLGIADWDEPAPTVTGAAAPSRGKFSVNDPRVACAPRAGAYGVADWSKPSKTVTGSARVDNSEAAVADPRVPDGAFGHVMRVTDWSEPTGTVTRSPAPSSGAPAVADPRALTIPGLLPGDGATWFKGKHGITPWDAPSRTVIGGPSNGADAVADPRFTGSMGVRPWDAPASTVTGESYPSNGSNAVADPRVKPSDWGGGRMARGAGGYGVRSWEAPAGTVTAGTQPGQGSFSVADPRVRIVPQPGNPNMHDGKYEVRGMDETAGTVTGATRPGSGSQAVADSRARDWFHNVLRVTPWDKATGTVTGSSRPSGGAPSVADPRLIPVAGSERWSRSPIYGVLPWEKASSTVAGGSHMGQGVYSVADPRVQGDKAPLPYLPGFIDIDDAEMTLTGETTLPVAFVDAEGHVCLVLEAVEVTKKDGIEVEVRALGAPGSRLPVVPVILARDGTWHRPMTTLELAVLQGLPTHVQGEPLRLAGKSISGWRERIGNAVPVGAAEAIAHQMLVTLLSGSLGTFQLSSAGGAWVEPAQAATLQ